MKNFWISGALLLLALPAAAQQTRCDDNARPRPDLGISIACENCAIGDYSRPTSWRFSREPRISAVAAGGAAAGVLEAGDEIVRVNGFTITSAQGASAFASPDAGRPMVLTIRRDGSLRAVTVTPVATCPEAIRSTAIVSGTSNVVALRAAEATSTGSGWLGVAFDCTDCSIVQTRPGVREWRFSEPPKIYSVETNSPAYRAGLRRGDVVTHVDGMVITQAEAGRRFGSVRPNQTMRISYRRDGKTGTVTVRAAQNPVRVAEVVSSSARTAEVELRELIEQQGRIQESARMLAAASERRTSEELVARLHEHALQNSRQLQDLENQLRRDVSDARKRELESQIRAIRESAVRHQQLLINELVVKQQEETRRLQQLQLELSRSGTRVPLVATARTGSGGSSYVYAPSVASSPVLRYSGSLGSTAIEVRGPTPVVVDQSGDTVTITIGSSVVKVTK